MQNHTIDFAKALTILTAVVEDQGYDRINRGDGSAAGGGCVYIVREDGTGGSSTVNPLDLKPSCIVGYVLHRLGILRAALWADATSGQYGACSVGSGLWDNAKAMGVEFTEDAQLFLRAVQSRQDGGERWGKAVTNAVETYREVEERKWKEQSGLFSWEVKEALDSLGGLGN